jgi:glutamine---fructose-6-phosphate transaminase (isomerizing)
MRAEIAEIPDVVRGQLRANADALATVAEAVRHARPHWVSIVARGTSDHAAVYAQFLIETHLGLPVGLASPSVTTVYGATIDWSGGLVLAVSQSGESPDIVAVVEAARHGGALTVAVTNERGSPLEAVAAHTVRCLAGEERAVAATKTYVAELAALAGIVAQLAPSSEHAGALAAVADVLAATLDESSSWLEGAARSGAGSRAGAGRPLVEAIAGAGRALVASRGFNLATALETALKLKETGRVFAEGYSTADLEHGPIALAAAGIPTLAFRPDGRMGAAIDPAVERARASGAEPWLIGGPEVAGMGHSLSLTSLAKVPESLTPLAYILPGQLLAEAVAVRLGLSPDAPTGLSKVTLTR